METTLDGFLGNRVMVRQPKAGFRSGADAVLLAASVPASASQSVLELGLGAGVASLCLASRVKGLGHSGLELQSDYADLARQNALANDVDLSVHVGDVAAMPGSILDQTFDHVFMNPPYYRKGDWTKSDAPDKSVALGEQTPLSRWLDGATRRLKPGGWLTLIQKSVRLRDVIDGVDDRLGSLQIKPIAPRSKRPAELVVIRMRKGGRAEPILYPPLIMHMGQKHEQDVAHPTPEAEAILRGGDLLSF